MHSWESLMKVVGTRSFTVERVRIPESGIVIAGDFAPPPLAHLPQEDQIFTSAFIASHGSIKEMEALFRISYPTVKNRLNRIAKLLRLPRSDKESARKTSYRLGILDALDSGKLTFSNAIEALKKFPHYKEYTP